jgi:Tfp pilus assembly major pilin PilA
MQTTASVLHRGNQRGLTRVEFAVSAAVCAVLAGLLLGVVLYYQELGEKTEVDLTILNIRAGIRYRVADRMMNGNLNELAASIAGNPVHFLATQPAGYVGELRDHASDPVGKGSWYFDLEQRELRYRPRLRSHLSPDLPLLRWRVAPIYASGGTKRLESLTLVNVEPYRWF